MARHLQYPNFAEFLWQARKWEYANFPSSQSRILFDILLLVEAYDIKNKNLSIKELQSLLPYSDRGVRYAVKNLIETEYCTLDTSCNDKRVRSLKSTNKLKILFDSYENFVLKNSRVIKI
jgi:hypothetical protein